MLDERSRGARQRGEIAGVGDGTERGVKLSVLPELARVLDDLLLRRRVGIAKRLGILDAMQVRHRRPRAIQAVLELFAREYDRIEVARRGRREQRIDARAVIGE